MKNKVLLAALCLLALPAFAQEKPQSTLFIYFTDSSIKAFPSEYVIRRISRIPANISAEMG